MVNVGQPRHRVSDLQMLIENRMRIMRGMLNRIPIAAANFNRDKIALGLLEARGAKQIGE